MNRNILFSFATLFIVFSLCVSTSWAQSSSQETDKAKSDTVKKEQEALTMNMFSEPFSSVEPFRKMQVPPSPQMASLGQFGETPVNHSTGVANIGIPIHTVTVNGYSHNIGLSYHGGGIKVNQVSSNVGLGWALNASGVLANTANKIGGDYVQLPTNFSTFNPHTTTTSFPDSRNNVDYMWAHDGLNNCVDTEPDVINFNFGSHSGVMVPVYQDVYREVPYTGLTIVDLGNSYLVIDKNYTQYTFDVVETTYLPPGCPGSLYLESGGCVNVGIYNNSYYLSKVESKEGGVINFFYEDENYSYAINRTEQKYSWITGNGCQADNNLIDVNCIQESSVSGKRLIRIETSENEQVIFKYKTESTGDGTREDLPGAKALQYLEVYNMGDVSPVKKIEFSTSYSSSSGTTGPNHQTAWDKRLKLDQVTVDTDQIYSFAYNGNLSPRLSYDQDYYGYHIYNYVYSAIPTVSTHNPNGANREPQASRVTAGMLNRINYPTGGYSTFEYEQNLVYFSNLNKVGPGVRIKRINSYTDSNVLANYKDYKYISEGTSNSSGLIDNLQSSVNFIDAQNQWQHDLDTGPYKLDCQFFMVSSDDQLSQFMGKTYSVSYSRVEEIMNDGSQGKVVYHFSKIGDIVPNPSVSVASINYDWTYGIPTKTETFKGYGGALEKIEETAYQYKTFVTNNTQFQKSAGPSSFYSFGMKLNRERAEVEPGQQWLFKPAVYNLFKYGYISALVSKTKETKKIFRSGKVFETNVFFSIDSLNSQTTKAVFRDTNTSGEAKSRYYYYTDEIGTQGNYTLYKEPILFLDKKIRGTTEYTVGGGYFPLESINSKRVHSKSYTIDLQDPSSSYSLNLSNPVLSTGIRLVSEVLSYNTKNYPTLIRDNQVKTKILYDHYDSKPVVFLTNFNATDTDLAYTSFESNFKGGWTYTIPSTPLNTPAFTGSTVFAISSNSISKSGLNSSLTYVLTFAVKKNGSETPNLIVKKGTTTVSDSGISNSDINSSWLIYQYKFTGVTSVLIQGSGILVDEVRLQPANTRMQTFGYIPFVGLAYENSQEMLPSNYSYDSQRRLVMSKNGFNERYKQFFYQYKAAFNY
ncbi:hypothetical protein [Algoriphagus yeomjeoni]|uniref:YD repeat-containing protein n=1 Tax=Algoriphagus yeomjeoni TaxID=291403 RepID=A0A327P4T1_9BACT|nr:hypothetical protein [Algoriphagus yeomjeoni]RAI86693.1 hypothetical protein LV83_03249 [Algoriphagus yeomjeoni]